MLFLKLEDYTITIKEINSNTYIYIDINHFVFVMLL